MSGLPLHPAFVHLPIGLAFAVPILAAGIALAHWRGRLPRAAFAVVIGLQALLVASGVIAIELGERDEDRVKRAVAERFIHEHEERAETFVWAAAAVLAVSLALLFVPARAVGPVAGAAVAGAITVAALAAFTGEAGGEIVYRQGGAAAWAAPAPRPGVDPGPGAR